jgi:hypothetical protein
VEVAELTINSTGSSFDTTLLLVDATCTAEVACNDDGAGNFRSLISLTNVAAGNYAVVVDGFSSATTAGPFTFEIRAVAVPGAACTSPLFGSGVLQCPLGTSCTGGLCQ